MGVGSDDMDARGSVRDFLEFQAEMGVELVPRPSASRPSAEAAVSEPTDEVVLPDTPAPESAVSEVAQEETPEAFEARVKVCRACALCEGRNHVVFGSGDLDADVMFIGEAPGRDEDAQGLPFVGAAGELLTKMIQGMQLERESVYIANVIKCRPPGNRDPLPEEIAACEPYLLKQIEMIQPKVICTLGRFAAQTLLKSTESMGRLRGKVYAYNGTKLVPTYHPAALLRNAQWKRPTWEDLKLVRFEYDGTKLQ